MIFSVTKAPTIVCSVSWKKRVLKQKPMAMRLPQPMKNWLRNGDVVTVIARHEAISSMKSSLLIVFRLYNNPNNSFFVKLLNKFPSV